MSAEEGSKDWLTGSMTWPLPSGSWLSGSQGQDEEDCLSVHTLQLGTL